MIPLKDDVVSRSTPIVTVLLIALNVAAYVYQVLLALSIDTGGRSAADAFMFEFGVTPCRLTGSCDRGDFPSPYVTIFTSMFLHGNVLHIGGNMLYLWIFGDNVEDALGHVSYVAFYLLSGLLAGLAHVALNLQSNVPSIGASGAIAGVMAGYLVLYPHASVRTLLFIGPFIAMPRVRAVLLIGFWFVLQLMSGLASIGVRSEQTTGVAFWAHIGGFIAGFILVHLFRPRSRAYVRTAR